MLLPAVAARRSIFVSEASAFLVRLSKDRPTAPKPLPLASALKGAFSDRVSALLT